MPNPPPVESRRFTDWQVSGDVVGYRLINLLRDGTHFFNFNGGSRTGLGGVAVDVIARTLKSRLGWCERAGMRFPRIEHRVETLASNRLEGASSAAAADSAEDFFFDGHRARPTASLRLQPHYPRWNRGLRSRWRVDEPLAVPHFHSGLALGELMNHLRYGPFAPGSTGGCRYAWIPVWERRSARTLLI
jgi:hypothetical protein